MVTRSAGTPRAAKFVSVDTGWVLQKVDAVVLPGAKGLSCEVSRRKSESTGPATLRQAKKKRPEAELGGPLGQRLPERAPKTLTEPTPSNGRPDVVADLAQYEAVHNPDGDVTYGIVANGNPCAEAILGELSGGPATYTGITDTHPYSVAWSPSGWYVADAGMNAVLKVDRTGHVSTVAVLPPQPVTLTQPMVGALAAEFGAPADAFDCLVGVTYAFEPVPTDVEVDQNGALYVSILPGGPESPALGARGKVFKVNASTGARTTVASGLLGEANVAVASDGTLYATELFGGKVTKFANGKRSTAVTVDRPLAVEVHGGYLYVGQFADISFGPTGPEVNAPGSVIRFKR
nr:ScyD/ScyE family protein [Terrabacter sp. Soil810]